MSEIISNWAWPQWTMLVMYMLGIALASAKHGESKGNHHAGWTVFGSAIGILVLTAGGFFG